MTKKTASKPRAGRVFWIHADMSVSLAKINGSWECLDPHIRRVMPKLKPGEQIKVRIVEVK